VLRDVDHVDRIVAGVRNVQLIRRQMSIGVIKSFLGPIRWQGDMTEQTKRHRLDPFGVDKPCATPRLAELTIRQATAHHLAAVGASRVIRDGLGDDHRVVILQAEVQAGRPRLIPERIIGVGAIHDLGQQDQSGIVVQLIVSLRSTSLCEQSQGSP
jgi:hypothetical protein